MLDDYKKCLVSEDWELSTYSTFEEAHSDFEYEEVKEFREKEGSTNEIFKDHITEYDKLYELKNLSRFLYYNGVRYFYFIQGKLDQIVEVETNFIIFLMQIYYTILFIQLTLSTSSSYALKQNTTDTPHSVNPKIE
jgi:hypothetical protein